MIYKSNGRLKPARKEEVASIKGKKFICKNCNTTIILDNVQFAEEQKCITCNGTLIEFGQDNTEMAKLTGRIN